MQAIAYLRVSTDEQAESQAGLKAQEDACRQWAARNDCSVADRFSDEGVSGAAGLDKRPELLAAITKLCPGDVLLVAKRDRIARDNLQCAMIEAAVARKKARIVSAAGEGTESDGPADVLMRRIVDAFGEYERLIIKARTKAAMQAKIRRGELVGTVPYGYILADDGRSLLPEPTEQEVIGIMQQLRAEGLGYEHIANELIRRGVLTKQGKRWGAKTVWQILKRAA